MEAGRAEEAGGTHGLFPTACPACRVTELKPGSPEGGEGGVGACAWLLLGSALPGCSSEGPGGAQPYSSRLPAVRSCRMSWAPSSRSQLL